MTECTQSRLPFANHGSREVVAEFSGGTMTSDSGALLLRETDQRMKLLTRFSQCFLDARNPALVQHPVEQMLAQRIYSLALGYEDLNDHEQLRQDPLLKLLAGKPDLKEPLAGKSTLNRMELGDGLPNRYKKITFWREAIDDLLVEVFLEAHTAAPEQIVLDIDATDFAIHGAQEGRFYHGYYDHYCYLPLYVFAGEHVLCARLRPSNIDPSAESRKEIERIVRRIRTVWPEVKIVLRGDAGFCREELMAWCEASQVDYVFGMARNPLLEKRVAEALEQARQSTPPLSIGDGLFAGVRTAPFGTASHPFGPRASQHDSFAAAQNRRADSRDSAQGLGPDEQQLPATNSLQPGSSATALLKSWRPVATRSLTTPKQISPHSRLVSLSAAF